MGFGPPALGEMRPLPCSAMRRSSTAAAPRTGVRSTATPVLPESTEPPSSRMVPPVGLINNRRLLPLLLTTSSPLESRFFPETRNYQTQFVRLCRENILFHCKHTQVIIESDHDYHKPRYEYKCKYCLQTLDKRSLWRDKIIKREYKYI